MPDRPLSKRWYRLSTLLLLLGTAAAVAWWPYSTSRVYDAVESFTRAAPFGGKVQLAEAGTHTFWIEGTCLSCHDNEPSEYRRPQPCGSRTLPVGRFGCDPATTGSSTPPEHEGRALWLFDAPEPGTYTISLAFETDGEAWDNTPPDNIAISKGKGLPVGIVRPMALFAGGGVAAAGVVALFVAWRRRRYFDSLPDA